MKFSLKGLLALFSFGNLAYVSAPYPSILGSTKAQLIAVGGTDVEEVIWTRDVIISAAQQSPFHDNMTGAPGSGKPIIVNNDTTKVLGNQIVFNTVDNLGAPIVQGNAVRVGQEEQLKPGDFRLTVDISAVLAGIDNTAQAQTIIGDKYNDVVQRALARRLAKQQSDDVMQTLKCSAVAANTVYPNGKTFDTLLSSDTFQTSLVVKAGGLLRDNGCLPMNAAPNPDKATEEPPEIPRYLHFLTDAGARPIKTESNYVQAAQFAQDRGDKNNLFTGVYLDYDGHVIYPWINIRHGAYGSIGSALQPEALLGTALTGRTTNSGVLPAGSGILDGGGSATNAAVTPLRNYFEFWSLFAYKPINGVTQTYSPHGSAIAYGMIIDKTAGKVGFFSYTGNTGNTLTGVVVIGSSTTGNYSSSAVGGVTWNTTPFLTAADGAGFLGVSDGAFASGSLMVECNSKGVPICFGLPMGEMAAVCGYGRVPTEGGGFKSMANRIPYFAPYGQARGDALQVAWGVAAFQRPDGLTPNYALEAFARRLDGSPSVVS